MNDSLRVIHETTDISTIERLEYEKRQEKDRLQRELRQFGPSPEDYSTEQCKDLMHRLECVESQLDFYRKLKRLRRNSEDNIYSDTDQIREAESSFETAFQHAQKENDLDKKKNKQASARIEGKIQDLFEKHLGSPKSPKHYSPTQMLSPTRSRRSEFSPKRLIPPPLSPPKFDLNSKARPNLFSPSQVRQSILDQSDEKLTVEDLSPPPTTFHGNLSKSALLKQFENQCKADQQLHQSREVQTAVLEDRGKELNAVLIQKECEREAELEAIRQENIANTHQLCEKLVKDLTEENKQAKKEFSAQMEHERKNMLERVKQKAERLLKEEREVQYADLLREEELKLQQRKQECRLAHEQQQNQDIQKLSQALAVGAQQKIHDLKVQFERERKKKCEALREEAARKLEQSLVKIRTEMQIAESEEIENLHDELKRKHETETHQLHDELEQKKALNLAQLASKMKGEKREAVEDYRQRLVDENALKLKQMESTFNAEVSNTIRSIETSVNAETDDKIAAAQHRHELQMKRVLMDAQQKFQRQSEELIKKSSNFLQQIIDGSSPAAFESLNFEPRGTEAATNDYPESYRDIRQASFDLNDKNKLDASRFQQSIRELLKQYLIMHEQHSTVVQRLGTVAQELLRQKRANAEKEKTISVLRNRLSTCLSHEKQQEATCRRLFQANETLLGKLG